MMKCFNVWLVVMCSAVACSAHAEDSVATEKSYLLTPATEPTPLSVGKSCQYKITIAPKSPWVLKTVTPLKADLKATDGIKLMKTTLTAADIVDPKPSAKTITTGCEAQKKGAQTIAAELSFFLCTDQICQRFIDKVDLALDVQ